MNKEEELLQRRFLDLARRAEDKGIPVFSDFLNLNEQNIFLQTLQKFSWINGKTFGGYEGAERVVAAFLPEEVFFDWDYPISAVHIRPQNPRFSDKLTHRDYLGSLMNLGIERKKLGDILVSDDGAVLFCAKAHAEHICNELLRICHTTVSCRLAEEGETFNARTSAAEVSGTVASLRLDSLMALAFHTSRSGLTGMIEEGRTFVNGRLVTSNGHPIKEGDMVSVRGLGRFRLLSEGSLTKKGRTYVRLEVYV